MTEAQWLKGADPGPMLKHLYKRGCLRKLRLFNIACCQRIRHLLSERALELLDKAKLRAEDKIPDDDLPKEYKGSSPAGFAVFFAAEALDPYYNKWALIEKQCRSAQSCADNAIEALANDKHEERPNPLRATERQHQAQLLRELFGNPFKQLEFDPAWRAWQDSVVARLAQAAYDEVDAEGHFDPARLAILADALEEAGCHHNAMLSHLRGPGPHVRGCWVVDLLLEKG